MISLSSMEQGMGSSKWECRRWEVLLWCCAARYLGPRGAGRVRVRRAYRRKCVEATQTNELSHGGAHDRGPILHVTSMHSQNESVGVQWSRPKEKTNRAANIPDELNGYDGKSKDQSEEAESQLSQPTRHEGRC